MVMTDARARSGSLQRANDYTTACKPRGGGGGSSRLPKEDRERGKKVPKSRLV